jgi:hypothetical protein
MNSVWHAFLLFPIMVATAHAQAATPALASRRLADCTDVVGKVLSKTRGRLLSFRSGKDKCTVVILLRKEGERPEKIVLQIDRTEQADDHQ